MVRKRLFVGVIALIALVLGFAGSAIAGARSDQYNNVVSTVSKPKPVAGVGGATATKGPGVVKAATGALPFTGLDLGIALAVGGALVGTGIVVRRAGRHSSDS